MTNLTIQTDTHAGTQHERELMQKSGEETRIVSSPAPNVMPQKQSASALQQINHAFGPVFAGLIIDSIDLITFGPLGLFLGLPIGAAAGYWLGHSMKLESKACWICSVVAAIYCTIPGTEPLPLGTVVGALVRFEDAVPPGPHHVAQNNDGTVAVDNRL